MRRTKGGPPAHAIAATALAAAAALVLASCGSGDEPAPKPTVSTARLGMTPGDGADAVAPDKPVTITVAGGIVATATVTAEDGSTVTGAYQPGGATWTTTAPLKYGTKYTVQATGVDAHGLPSRGTETFTTLTPQSLVAASKVTPGKGDTVGVGMPISIELDHAVDDPAVRAAVERRLSVSASVPIEGAWGWVDAKTVRFRPKDYWPAGTKVSVSGNLYGVSFGNGAYGAAGTTTDFTVGSALVATVDSAAHEMTVVKDGEVVRTVPVTTGKPGFTTRAGTKVILDKEEHVLMDGTTVGIAEGSSDAYRLDVYWATRVTWSGEYLHAAPWSVSSQGSENVSHGCVGMSTDNAKWFFGISNVGDVVKVVNTGSDKTMELSGNGYGEWNYSWDEWLKTSTVGTVTTGALPAAA
ncbi:L,D-transpeptidase [Uniformispora flossi]|uniref:L,D-transpeptidase n=1 Tax=Uniformispora flossi TaxID=3390723 RepID=UPI003C2ED033